MCMIQAINHTEIRQVQQLIQELNQQDAAVVVEGRRDADALRRLGFVGTLMQFHRYGGFVRFADTVESWKRIIILFDYDHEGRYMTHRLIRLLQRRTRIDLSYHRRLAKITRGRVRCVEQLAAYAQ